MQVEHGGHEPAADPLAGTPRRRTSAARRRPRRSGQDRPRRARRGVRAASARGRRRRATRFHLPAPSSPQRKPIEPFGTTGSPLRRVDDHGLPLGVLARRRRGRTARRNASATYGAVPLAQRDEERQVGVPLRVLAELRHVALDVELLQDHGAPSPSRARRRCRPRRAASGRRTSCARRSPARRPRPSGPGSAPRS